MVLSQNVLLSDYIPDEFGGVERGEVVNDGNNIPESAECLSAVGGGEGVWLPVPAASGCFKAGNGVFEHNA